jgi:hypothetical protein
MANVCKWQLYTIIHSNIISIAGGCETYAFLTIKTWDNHNLNKITISKSLYNFLFFYSFFRLGVYDQFLMNFKNRKLSY